MKVSILKKRTGTKGRKDKEKERKWKKGGRKKRRRGGRMGLF